MANEFLFSPEHRARLEEAKTLFNEGVSAVKAKNWELARDKFRRVISLAPRRAEAHMNLGSCYRELGRLDEAIRSYQRAAEIDPKHPIIADVYFITAACLNLVGRVRESVSYYRRALALSPNPVYHSNFLLALNYHPDYGPADLLREALKWNELYAAPLASKILPHGNDRSPERRLRIGYLSNNFQKHAPLFAKPVLEHHDHEHYEIFCYSNTRREELTSNWGIADHWRFIADLDDDAAAALIRADAVDILVDLCAHMENRALVVARKPAPIQVSYFSYPGTSGIRAIDYRLTDPFLDPPGSDVSVYSERTIWLPDTWWCYDAMMPLPVGPLPALASGRITFGCLNHFTKVGEESIALWSRVLRAVPDSRMVLLAPEGWGRGRALSAFERGGIEHSRIELVGVQPRDKYFATYDRIDVALDPVHCGGHTTSLDASYMGAAVVTLVGPTICGRAGLSILSNLGLPQLVAHTPYEYVRIATALAAPEHRERLAELRAGLRARMERSPLMNAPRFVRALENVYRECWRAWCRDETQ